MENIIDPTTGLVVLIKKAGESRVFNMDCTKYMRDSDTINTLTGIVVTKVGNVDGSLEVTTSGDSHDGAQTVQASYAGGTDLEDYRVKATIVTAGGDTLTPEALLRVRD